MSESTHVRADGPSAPETLTLDYVVSESKTPTGAVVTIQR